ncbi:glycosyltransferase family 4 protein [Paenibacillus sp. Y412MC10]|uniref:glycosyltransferase family 4 protein n=1 Tax=Geobacillus sp. (strain Y412MC10) TaxID=481743 RepID=UPI0011AB51B1|nr:glycosyltransferase family 4 protein [Paenibacillus sp. Y412MC10]
MLKQGIVSVGSKFHATFTAESLERGGMLKTFYTGKKVNSQTIPDQHITRISLPLMVGYALRKMPLIGQYIPYNLLSDILFDCMVSIKLKKADFIIGFNNYSLMQMKKLKKQKSTLFLEQRIAHVLTEIQIYNDEFGRVPANLHPLMVKRKLQEYDMADYILVPSEFVYQSMIDNGVSEKKLLLVPYGYDAKLFKRDTQIMKPDDCLRLLFVGQIGHRKGLKYLLDAVKNIKQKRPDAPLDLVLVGGIDNDFVPYLNQYSNLYRHIDFVPQRKLVELYNSSHIFVFPSLCEGSAVVTYEALGSGLPQIVTFNAGSVISDNEEGIIIPPRDTAALEKAILHLMDNPAEIKRMEQNAINKAKEFTWEKYGDRLISTLHKKFDSYEVSNDDKNPFTY